MSDPQTILLAAAVGVMASVITAWVTTKMGLRADRERWSRDLGLKFAEALSEDPERAYALAKQFAIGTLLVPAAKLAAEAPSLGIRWKKNRVLVSYEKIFIAPNSRLVVGRDPGADIVLADPTVSRHGAMLSSDDQDVYIVDLGS